MPGAVTLTADERDRLADLLFSHQLIDVVFRACREPQTVVSAARKLVALRRDSEAKAQQLLEI